MKRSQIIGLVLIVACGFLSQFTAVKHYPLMVWAIALLAVVGMVLVLKVWFKSW